MWFVVSLAHRVRRCAVLRKGGPVCTWSRTTYVRRLPAIQIAWASRRKADGFAGFLYPDSSTLVLLGGKVYRCCVHAFLRLSRPRWVFSSVWPCPHQGPLARNQAAMTAFPRSVPLHVLLERVREQYRGVPGLSLTKTQATRLFGVAPSVCAAALRALVMEEFLSRTG